MQMITVSGPPSAGKTSVILKAAACLRGRGCAVGVVKFDCLFTDDDQLYAAEGFPAKKALSRERCPDHFFISNMPSSSTMVMPTMSVISPEPYTVMTGSAYTLPGLLTNVPEAVTVISGTFS